MNNDALLEHRSIQVWHSMNQLAELPAYTHDSALPMALRHAAMDAFFVHLGLIAEFLAKDRNTQHGPVIHHSDYASNFHLDPALRERLLADYELASRHVTHYSADRAPTVHTPVQHGITPADLRDRADGAFTAMRAWVRHVVATGSVHGPRFVALLDEAKSRRAV